MGASASASCEPAACPDLSCWCRELQDLTLNQLWGIPATHNSGCVKPRASNPAWLWAQTQSADIPQQLRMGVRSFDLRLCDDAGDGLVWISHGLVSSLTLQAVLGFFSEFLRAHPSEFIVVQLRRDADRKFFNPQALRALFEERAFHLPAFEPLGLDTPLRQLAGGLLVASTHFDGCCPVLWPFDLFDGPGLVPMWHWRTLDEAKQRVDQHVLSGQHLITSKGQLTGVALDGTFYKMPPSTWAAQLQAWLLERVRGDWAPLLPRLGLVMVDYATPDFCAEIVRRSQCGAAECPEEDACTGGAVGHAAPRDVCGICHVGVSRRTRERRLEVASREELPPGCALSAEVYANHHADVYECTLTQLGPKRMELTVCRTDTTEGGWGQDLFVRWRAQPKQGDDPHIRLDS